MTTFSAKGKYWLRHQPSISGCLKILSAFAMSCETKIRDYYSIIRIGGTIGVLRKVSGCRKYGAPSQERAISAEIAVFAPNSVLERVLGRQEAKAVREREKGTCDTV